MFDNNPLRRGKALPALAGLVAALALAGFRLLGPGTAAGSPSPASLPTPLKSGATAVLAGGCFWGMEAVFERLRGVSNVVAGFSGGSAANAHYDTVSTGTTGHAESIQVTYDPKTISYAQLLDVYFRVAHDPTERNRQGPDDGTQYRSAIFYANAGQERVAKAKIRELETAHVFAQPIVTEVVSLRAFYPAEAYHQHFVDRNPDNPYVVVNDLPKLAKLRSEYAKLIKPSAAQSAADGV